MKKHLFHLYFSVLCCIFSLSPTLASENTLRVAFLPDMYGFYNIEENGDYSGYNYDYLMNVAQHTGWDYEFIIIQEGLTSTSLVKAQEMLAQGEIDLLGPFSATSTHFDDFESGQRNYGVYRYCLYSSRHNYSITQDNYFLQDSLKVALVESFASINESYLLSVKDYDVDIHYVQSHSETHELLFHEEVDAIINLDLSSNAEDLDYLTTVEHIPFYFISTKGNSELMAQLDDAIEKIEIVDPHIHQILKEKYFGTRYDSEFVFTEEEKQVLDTMESIKVGMLVNEPPYQYQGKNGENIGISIDILDYLSDIIGFPYEIIWKDSHDELVQAIENQEIDMISTLPKDYPLASSLSVILTNAYITSHGYWLRSIHEVENPEVLFHFISTSIPFYAKDEMRTTFDIESDLKTLNETGSLSIFCDPYVTAYYLGLHQLENIEVKAVTDVLSEMAFGVGAHIDVSFIGMINRAILYLDSYMIDEIIYHHTSMKPEYSITDLLHQYAAEIFAVLLLFSLVVIISIRNTSNHFKELSRRDGLTELYNSGYFHDYSSDKVPKLTSGALILIDIDYFKDVNDTYGHHMGDEIIKQVAKNIKQCTKENYFHARLGGDEFVILIEGDITQAEIESGASSLLEGMAKNETGVTTTLSIGAYIFRSPLDYKTLYQSADKVLYQVKEKGRNGFQIYDEKHLRD